VKGCPSLPTVGYAGGDIRHATLEAIWRGAALGSALRPADDCGVFARVVTTPRSVAAADLDLALIAGSSRQQPLLSPSRADPGHTRPPRAHCQSPGRRARSVCDRTLQHPRRNLGRLTAATPRATGPTRPRTPPCGADRAGVLPRLPTQPAPSAAATSPHYWRNTKPGSITFNKPWTTSERCYSAKPHPTIIASFSQECGTPQTAPWIFRREDHTQRQGQRGGLMCRIGCGRSLGRACGQCGRRGALPVQTYKGAGVAKRSAWGRWDDH
jgi:hypothetical protein